MSDPRPTPPVVTAKDEEQAGCFLDSIFPLIPGDPGFSWQLASALAAARAEGAADERSAVVRHLRALEAVMKAELFDFRGVELASKPRAIGRRQAYGIAAERIQRGDHRS